MIILTHNYDQSALGLGIKREHFRSRPVVNLEAELSFVSEAGKIDMASQECELSTGEAVACVPIKTCLKYTGLGVEKKIGNTLTVYEYLL